MIVRVLLCLVGLCASLAAAQEDRAGELVFKLQYIAGDYGAAVRDGGVVDTFEYGEMIRFARESEKLYRALVGTPVQATDEGFAALRGQIERRESWDDIRERAETLRRAVVRELEVRVGPTSAPDLIAGAALYTAHCARCHGADGEGGAVASLPPPSSFRDERMQLLSPLHVVNATRFGIDGTTMPSYADDLTDSDLWNLGFYLMTLRADFAPAASPAVDYPGLAVLAELSNRDLEAQWTSAGRQVEAGDIDYYRAHPHPPREAESAPVSPGLRAAIELEEAFAAVAEGVSPSVAGIVVYVPAGAASDDAAPGGWRVAGQIPEYAKGMRARGAGSGFVVTEDGYLLTRYALIADLPKDALIDIELPENRHYRARIVGFEPSIDLAVLKVEDAVRSDPVTIDSATTRVGQWAIALGDPPGVEQTFAAGVISASPIRDCYQENLTATLLQTSLAIAEAGFGGPLVDIRGRVIGMTVPRSRASGSDTVYALPIETAMTVFEALRVTASQRSPWLGISVLDLTRDTRRLVESPPRTGVYIEDVYEPSPAARAGVRVGDVLVSMDGHNLYAVADFQKWLYLLGIGHQVTAEISRNGKIEKMLLAIERRPDSVQTR